MALTAACATETQQPVGSADVPASTSTTREHIGSTATEPAELGPVPDPTAPLAGFAVAPARLGGLSTWGAGVYSVDELLGRVEVAPESAGAGYERDLFGGWRDLDGDGCDTRDEVLQAESAAPVTLAPDGCGVVSGQYLSIYDGYSTPDPSELEVDHLVALSEAWRSGASVWSPERRAAFANDLGHPGALVAVTAAMNRSKSDRDPASWQPPNRGAWCAFTADWVTVKARWQLTMDTAEARAVRNMLAGCGQRAVPTSTSAPPPSTTAPPPPPGHAAAAAPASNCDRSYPTVCIPPAPPDLDCGDVPYRRFTVVAPDPHGFDGDHDGVGCES